VIERFYYAARQIGEDGCMNTSEVAVLLGFQEHDIAPLLAAKLLMPLGKPAPKYFTATEVLACADNRDWLSHATRAIAKHWAVKNRARTPEGEPDH
jgi:hypothetical protein